MFEDLSLKQKIIIIIIGVFLIMIIMYKFFIKNSKVNDLSDENILIHNFTNISKNEDLEEIETIIIHITGAVKNPGVVTLKEGSRVEDAIESAGGLTEDADISNVNLAYVLEDGIKICIPIIKDENSKDNIDNSTNEIITTDIGNILEDNSKDTINKININKASQTDLETLPGIGGSLALKIIEYRDANGKFSTIEDLKNVSGIGENKFESLKEYIYVK